MDVFARYYTPAVMLLALAVWLVPPLLMAGAWPVWTYRALHDAGIRLVAEAIRLGRRTVRVIQGNIGFALAVKALFLGLALTGHTSLWLAILADTGATLVVVANALRLLSVAGAGPRRGGKRS